MEEDLKFEGKLNGGRQLAVGERVLVREDLGEINDYEIPFGLSGSMRRRADTFVTIASSSVVSWDGGFIARYTIHEDYGCCAWNNFMFKLEDEQKEEEPEPEIELMEICLKADTPSDEEIEKMISLVNLETFSNMIKARCSMEGWPAKEVNEKVTEDVIKNYLKTWAVNKYRFYKLFGDKLYIEEQVEVKKTQDTYREVVQNLRHKYPLYAGFLDHVSISDIEKNAMSGYSNDLLFEDSRIKKKMKFTKVAALFNDNDFNMDISKMYQDKNMKSIRISIDPCDYLTVSVNKNGWRSCHNFFDGEYRNAGLALLNDRTSLVAYSYSVEDYKYKSYKFEFSWNSKNWRQMIYVSETNSSIIFSLPYPNSSPELEDNVRRILEDRMSSYLDVPNIWRKTGTQSVAQIRIERSDYCYMYNDIGRNGCKYVVNKHDKQKGAEIYTGADELRGIITDEIIEGSTSEIW